MPALIRRLGPPRLLLCLALALILAAPIARAADPGWIKGFEDLPLAPGLASVERSDVDFDSPEGRILIAYAQGQQTRDAVLRFYADALPQLGWETLSATVYRRVGEVLHIECDEGAQPLTVRFSLTPAQ